MKHKEVAKVSKSAWEISEHTKTLLAQNVVAAVSRGNIKIDKDELPRLIALLNSTVEQGYNQALKNFEKSVEKSLENALPTKKN